MDAPVVNYVFSPFEGNINPGDPQRIKLYIQAKNYIDKEDDKVENLVSNSKDIICHFLSLSKKYVWEGLSFMVQTGSVPKIF